MAVVNLVVVHLTIVVVDLLVNPVGVDRAVEEEEVHLTGGQEMEGLIPQEMEEVLDTPMGVQVVGVTVMEMTGGVLELEIRVIHQKTL